MNLTPVGSFAKATTTTDVIFRAACLLVGIQTGFRKKLWLDRALLSLWIAHLVSFACIFPFYCHSRLASFTENPTMCEMMTLAFIFIFSMAVVYAIFCVRYNRDVVEPLLRRDGRRFTHVAVPIGCEAASMAWQVKSLQFSPHWHTIYIRFSNLAFRVGLLSIFLKYTELVSAIVEDETAIVKSLTRADPSVNHLIARKWNIRERISNINLIFARSLLMYFLVMFLTLIYFFGHTIAEDMHPWESIFMFTSFLCNLLQLLVFARKCSAVKFWCYEADRLLLVHTRSANICKTCHSDLSAVLRFHEQWDALKVGCFSFDVETFFKFLATGITCLAVILQFDYKLMRRITALSNSKTQ